MRTNFVIASLIGVASAWWDQGHLMTARRAYDILQTENPEVLDVANRMLDNLKNTYPELTKGEAEYSFVECAVFADFLKTIPGNPFGW